MSDTTPAFYGYNRADVVEEVDMHNLQPIVRTVVLHNHADNLPAKSKPNRAQRRAEAARKRRK